ncbi:MAG: hypothetical protein JNK82_45075, partial [Myxococcaceae bacterium]|nr:hypothetical protein [Myxococcaceae bacterium]
MLRLALMFVALSACAPRGWFTKRGPAVIAPVPLESASQCPELGATGPVVVLVPGIGGEIERIAELHEQLEAIEPRAVLTFRWTAFETTSSLVERFSAGMNQLAAC